MFLAHSFRLRDPWQCDCMPAGGLRWSRVFHRPSGLEDDDALWLVCSGLPAGAAVTVNGQTMTPGATAVPPVPGATGVPPVRTAERAPASSTGDTPLAANQFEVTALIAETNRIEIDVPSALQPPAASLQADAPFPFDVRLGIVGHS